MRGRRVIFTGKGKVEIEEFDVARPNPDQVLIQTLYSAISPGTERAMLLAEPNTVTHDRGFPFQPGYSNIGRVIEAGAEVKNYRQGELVATVQTHTSHSILPDTIGPGLAPPHYRHLFASPITPDVFVPQLHHLWKIPAGVKGADLKPLAAFAIWVVGLGGSRKPRIELGEPVLVIGLGPIGLSAAKHAQLSGGFPVIGLDRSPNRRALAKDFGLDVIVGTPEEMLTALGGKPPPVVIEATGRPDVIPLSFQLCANQGRVVLLSSTRGVTPEIDFYRDVHRKGLTLYGSHESARPTYETRPGYWSAWDDRDLVLRLLAAGRLPGPHLISHSFPVVQAKEAYDLVINTPDALSVLLEWE